MQIASRLAIAVHVLSLLGIADENQSDSDKRKSEWLAGSIGVNPVIVRNVTGMLRRAGLVTTHQGVAGAYLAKTLETITLLDIYHAVEAVDEGELFALHPQPNPDCLVGANIQTTLEGVFGEAQRAMEARLAATTMQQIVNGLRSR
jgi:DNA-binding IscR family transcriptional regulator